MPTDSDLSQLCPDESIVLLPRGSRYAGQALDVSSRRSIAILPIGESENLVDSNEDRFIVDGFYHLGEFWRAIIHLDGVANVYGQAFNFSKPKTRLGKNGREVYSVDLEAGLRGEVPLPVLHANDVVYVPKSVIAEVGTFVELYINRINFAVAHWAHIHQEVATTGGSTNQQINKERNWFVAFVISMVSV